MRIPYILSFNHALILFSFSLIIEILIRKSSIYLDMAIELGMVIVNLLMIVSTLLMDAGWRRIEGVLVANKADPIVNALLPVIV